MATGQAFAQESRQVNVTRPSRAGNGAETGCHQAGRLSAKGFSRAGHTPSLVASLLHFDVSFMVWVLLGALGATIGADLGLSGFQKGLMIAVPPLSGSAFRLILGPLVDRFGARRTGLASLALTFVPLTWGWLAAGTYVQVLGLGLLLGIAGSSFVIALPLASRWYPPEQQGLAMGIAGAGNSGTLIAALAAPRVAVHVGWHATFGLALIPVALVWVLFAVMAKEPPQPGGARHDHRHPAVTAAVGHMLQCARIGRRTFLVARTGPGLLKPGGRSPCGQPRRRR